MNLDEAQKSKVAAWVAEGLKLSEIQKRLASELGVSLTYIEVRLLVDDLKLTPKDAEPARTAELKPAGSAKESGPKKIPHSEQAPLKPGMVSVRVDSIARPGTVISGSVVFSDGKTADWQLDQMGRLGLVPKQQGYRPSQQDVAAFQAELQNELARLGF